MIFYYLSERVIDRTNFEGLFVAVLAVVMVAVLAVVLVVGLVVVFAAAVVLL
jgi:hypothetical protein